MSRTTPSHPLSLKYSWGPIVGLLIIALSLAGLYLYHQQQFTLATGVLQQLGRANDDLSRGYLHLALADAPDSPWQREQGLTLLDQALDNYEQIVATLEKFSSSSAIEPPSTAEYKTIAANLERFRGDVNNIKTILQQSGPIESDHVLGLRMTTYSLSQQTATIEQLLRNQLQQALRNQDRLFYSALLVALLLVLLFFSINWVGNKRRRESESRFRQLTETISEVFWLTDSTKDTMLYVSPAYEKIWGRSCQSLLDAPSTWLDAIHPDDRPRVQAAMALQAQGRYREIYRIIRPDGELRWIEDRAFPVMDDHDIPYRIAGLATDITEFKAIEARLQRQEGLLKQASHLARFGAWQVDVIAQTIHLSDEVSRILELPPGKAIPLSEGLDMYPPKWRPLVTRAVERCIATGEAYELELQVSTLSGRLRWVHVQGQAVRDHTDKVVRLEGSFQDLTEQKNLATLLGQGGGQRFHQLADALPFIIWSAEPNGTIDYANRQFSHYTGVELNPDLSQQRWIDALHPDDRQPAFRLWRDAIVSGNTYVAEFRLQRADGQYHWHLARSVPVRDEQGDVLKWYGSAVDIHDRKTTEEKAQHLAERLAVTLESITDAFFTLNTDWHFTYVNSEAELVLKRPRQQILGKSMWEVFPEVAGSVFETHYRQAVEENRKTSFEAYYPPLEAWFSVNAYPSSEGLAVYFQDVTERRREQEQMRLLQTCIDHMNDALLITEAEPQDEPGPRILYANPAFERITGYSLAEVKGKSPRFLQGPDTQRDELDRVRSAMQHWQPVRAELINYTKSGEEFWIEMELVPLADDKGWYTHWVALERDITERKRIEELEQAHQVAALASEAKSHFLASMSHEIRTPINGVIGMVDVLHQTSLQGYQVEMVDIIRDSASSLLSLIEDILDFSKIEAGRLELESIPVSLTSLVRKIAMLLDRMAETNGVNFTLYTDPALPARVLGDELRIKQILLNLVNNAIKFSGNRDVTGDVSLRVHLLERVDDWVRVEFRIEDNGIGMDEATLQRLFSPFMQADASTTRHYGGTGLGLSITHNLVTMMGGSIHVSSQAGKGTEFRLQLALPLCAGETDEGEAPTDISGVNCVLVGESRLMDDLDSYLQAADAQISRVRKEKANDKLAPPEPPAPWVWIVDAGPSGANIHHLAKYLPPGDHTHICWLVLGRGQRRRPRKEENRVLIDINVMDQSDFIGAVALAAGRVSLNADKMPAAQHHAGSPPSRMQALEQHKLILVAEDNITNQNVIRHQLGLLGYAADLTSDGEEAFACWQKGHYALVLTDLHMPQMDGYELVSLIRQQEKVRGQEPTPIIALTANAQQSEADHCRELGMNEYLTKPVALNVLGATLATWLEPVTLPEETATRNNLGPRNAVLDVRVLAELVGKDALILREFLLDFRRDADRMAREIHEALNAGDLATVVHLAHTLKSSARSVGAQIIGERSAQLEYLAKTGDTDKLPGAFKHFEADMRGLLITLNRYIEHN